MKIRSTYYMPLIGRVYQKRLKMALVALGDGQFDHLLEIGHGSGVFLPALSERARRLSAFDLHPHVQPVQTMLAAEGIKAAVWSGDILAIDAPDGEFDAVVCLSVLEHLAGPELDQALREIARVSRADSSHRPGFPHRNVITDTFYRAAGFSPRLCIPPATRRLSMRSRRR